MATGRLFSGVFNRLAHRHLHAALHLETPLNVQRVDVRVEGQGQPNINQN